MKIEEISVKNIIIDNIHNLYESAFPRDERRDFEDFLRLLADPESRFSVYAFLRKAILPVLQVVGVGIVSAIWSISPSKNGCVTAVGELAILRS